MLQKRGIYQQIVRVLESHGGLILSHIAIFFFYGYLFLAHWKPNSGLVKLLQAHGSTAQVVSIAAILTGALLIWWGEKVLFRLKEREELEHLRHLVAELQPLPAKVAFLEEQNAEQAARIAEQAAHNAELASRNAELASRNAELENQKTPSQPAQQSETPPS